MREYYDFSNYTTQPVPSCKNQVQMIFYVFKSQDLIA